MSLRDFKDSLRLVESSQWTRQSAGTAGVGEGQDRKPPKGRLKDQMASILRQAADMECTLVGDSLPAASASPPFPPLASTSAPAPARSLPPLPPRLPLGPHPKRRKLSDYAPSLVLDPLDLSLPNPLPTDDTEEISLVTGLRSEDHQSDIPDADRLDCDKDDDDGIIPDKTNGDSEAGLFIQSQTEGLHEPLVLRAPEAANESDDPGGYVQVPASINGRLMPHQREGVHFLYRLYRDNKGGVLGDDMGLGKTIQVIAFLAAVLQSDVSPDKKKTEGKPHMQRKKALIVAPTSVLRNWEQEFHAWGAFDVAIYHGAYRDMVLRRLESGSLQIVLTSFDTFRIHGESLCIINWDCMVIDEAHRLKNDKSDLYKACSKVQTMRRYGLTGTIMQNRMMDLFNVFDWVAPGCLGSREHFREYYDEPLKQGQRISAPERFVRIAENRKQHLAKVLQKFLLRREKQGTIGHLMMGKEDNVIFCEMSPLQRRVYKRLLASPDFQALTRKDEPCSCGSPRNRAECCFRMASQGIIWQYLHRESTSGCDSCPICLILPCLTKLQQVSNHLELIKPNAKDDPEKQKKDELLAELVLAEDARLVGGTAQEESFLGLSDTQHCGKMRVLELLLAHWVQQGDKVLLFSYSVRMLDILDKFLIRKGYCFSRLDGSTPMSLRQPMVDDFNRSPSKQIFLISTRAGGLGLNLVSANRVVIFDPNWNPANDLQAQDRSFRFGQRRHVTVYRLLAAGSLEELVYTRQIYKQQLFNIAVSGNLEKRYFEGVQDSKDKKGELFGISNLFKDLSDEAFTSDIIEQHEKRALNFQVKNFPTTTENTKNDGLVTEMEEPAEGTNSCVSHDSFKSHVTLRKCSGKQPTNNALSLVLQAAGVVYSHRNEDVVNCKASTSNSKNYSEYKILRTSGTEKSGFDLTVSNKPIKAAGHEVKEARRRKPSPSFRNHMVGNKQEQFESLAKFKGMEKTQFCKWLLSVSESEKQSLLFEFKQQQK